METKEEFRIRKREYYRLNKDRYTMNRWLKRDGFINGLKARFFNEKSFTKLDLIYINNNKIKGQ